MTPFDINKAKDGASVVTTSGVDVEIVGFDGGGLYPIRVKKSGFIHTYTQEGHFFLGRESNDDLMMKD